MKVVQIWMGEIPPLIQKLMDDLKHKCKKENIEYIRIIDNLFENTLSEALQENLELKIIWERIPKIIDYYRECSDLLRFWYLSKNKETMYIDSDIKVHKFPQLTEEDTFTKRPLDKIDYCIIYRGTKEKSVINDMLSEYVTLLNREKKQPYTLVLFRTMQKYKEKVGILPKDWYTHY